MKTLLSSLKDCLSGLILSAMLCLGPLAIAQTTLTAGDIAFTGYNCNNAGVLQNDFSFIILRTGGISAGTMICFTDNGYKIAGTNALNTTEGTLVWSSSTAMAQFTQVYVQVNPAGNAVLSLSAGNIVAGFNDFVLGQVGDQVLAYQGPSASPTFISGIHMNSDPTSTQAGWDNMASGTTFTQNRSDMPPGLTGGVNCVAPDPNIGTSEKDNGIYNCTGAAGVSLANVRTAINTPANWSIQDNTSYALPPSCSFSLSSTLAATISGTNVVCSGGNTGAASVSVSGGVPSYTYAWAPSGGTGATASNLTTGTYTVTITDGASTQITRTITITATNATPTLNITASSTTVCAGATVTLTASGASQYFWSNGVANGTGFVINATQSYTVTGNAGVCSSTAAIAITANPRPLVIANATSTVICIGNPVTLNGSGAATYTWSNGVTNGTAFNPTTTTSYTVTGANANGCTDQAAITVSVSTCAGIEDYQSNVSIKLYPNPTKNSITILQEESLFTTYVLYNMNGALISEHKIESASQAVDLAGFSEGIYFIRLNGEANSVFKKIVLIK